MPTNEMIVLNRWDYLFLALLYGVIVGALLAWAWLIARLRRHQRVIPAGWSVSDIPTPGSKPWPAATLGATLLIFFLTDLLGYYVTVTAMANQGAAAKASQATIQMGILAQLNVLRAALVLLGIVLTSRIRPGDLGLSRFIAWRRDLYPAIVFVLLLLPIVYLAQGLAAQFWKLREHPVQTAILSGLTSELKLLMVVSAAIAAPIAEELVFRGVLLGWLTTVALKSERRLSSWQPGEQPPPRALWVPNILVSWLFAAMHYQQWPAPIALYLLSLGLGWMAQRTGRLTGPILAHAAFNGLSTVLILIAAQAKADRAATAPKADEAVPATAVLGRLTPNSGDLGSR